MASHIQVLNKLNIARDDQRCASFPSITDSFGQTSAALLRGVRTRRRRRRDVCPLFARLCLIANNLVERASLHFCPLCISCYKTMSVP